MKAPAPPLGVACRPRRCWLLTARPPGAALELDATEVHLENPQAAVEAYLDAAESAGAGDDLDPGPEGGQFLTHVCGWLVTEHTARAAALEAIAVTSAPCWTVTCPSCHAPLEDGETERVLHFATAGDAIEAAARAGWTAHPGRLRCEVCAGRLTLAEQLDAEAADRSDPDQPTAPHPDQLALPVPGDPTELALAALPDDAALLDDAAPETGNPP